MSVKFVLRKTDDGTYVFEIVTREGELIATSESFTARSDAQEAIQSIKQDGAEAFIEDQTGER